MSTLFFSLTTPVYGRTYTNPWEALYQHEMRRLERIHGFDMIESAGIAEWADVTILSLADYADDMDAAYVAVAGRRAVSELDTMRHEDRTMSARIDELDAIMRDRFAPIAPLTAQAIAAAVDFRNRGDRGSRAVCVHGVDLAAPCADCREKCGEPTSFANVDGAVMPIDDLAPIIEPATSGVGFAIPAEPETTSGACEHFFKETHYDIRLGGEWVFCVTCYEPLYARGKGPRSIPADWVDDSVSAADPDAMGDHAALEASTFGDPGPWDGLCSHGANPENCYDCDCMADAAAESAADERFWNDRCEHGEIRKDCPECTSSGGYVDINPDELMTAPQSEPVDDETRYATEAEYYGGVDDEPNRAARMFGDPAMILTVLGHDMPERPLCVACGDPIRGWTADGKHCGSCYAGENDPNYAGGFFLTGADAAEFGPKAARSR